ncbi:RHS repeat domain-containing protein [Maridesulfovibrio sp.]|uniref:RHS repeat domain-containing protein n=1 Tax=Maridesulfovibrio sp. TaxID=2795000 RepID=UPI003BAD7A7A
MSYDFQKESWPRTPQTGTGANLFDEFERDNVEFNSGEAVRVASFTVPGTSEPFSELTTVQDENGRIDERQIAFENFNQDLKYEYDDGGRLHKVWSGERLIEEYLYGEFGERYFGATARMPQRTFRYGPGVRLEKAGNVKYFYDEHGRLSKKQHGSEVTEFSYHHSGQLEQVALPDGKQISYTIDPEGMRIAKSINGKMVESYLWHDFISLAVVADNYGNRKEFAYDEDGDPIAMRFNENMYYFAADQVGTIYIVANDGGIEVKRIIRDSFGNKIVDTNERMEIPLGFAAGLYDKDTGLVHFGSREYDPSIGRFITPDPLGLAGGDVDAYGYCADDPVNFIDRVGLQDESEKGDGGTSGSKSSSGATSAKSDNSGSRSSTSNGYSGGDFGPGYNGTSGSAYGPTSGGWGYNTDPGGSHYNGDNSLGGEGQNRNARKGGQNVQNNKHFETQNQQALDHLNQSGALAGKKADQAAQGLAQKQAQLNATEQAKKDRKAANEARLDKQRRASLVNKKDKGFFATVSDVADGVGEAMEESWEAAGKAVAKTVDTLQGDEKNAMKFAGYVSPEKQDFYNTMMDYTKKAAINGVRKGAKQYSAVGALLAPVTGAAGMLTGTLIGINNMNKKR